MKTAIYERSTIAGQPGVVAVQLGEGDIRAFSLSEAVRIGEEMILAAQLGREMESIPQPTTERESEHLYK